MKRYLRFFVFLFLFAGLPLFAQEGENAPIGRTEAFRKKVFDGGIPLPRETSYQQQGFGVGLGGGAFFSSGTHCNTLAVWQGTLEYYYAQYLSAGFSARMYGGNVDDKYSMIYQRYHTHLRMHHLIRERWSVYVGPTLGFETTDLTEIRHGDNVDNSLVSKDEEIEAVGCKNEYSLDGLSGGIAMGTGFAFSDDWAVNGGTSMEYNTAEVGQLTVAFGLGFNLRNHADFLKKNFLGGWIVLEGLAHRYFGTDTGAWGLSVFLAFIFNI